MAVSEDDMIVKTEDYFVTKNTLNPKATMAEIEEFLAAEEVGGNVTVTRNGGGVRGVTFTQTKTLDDTESNEVRRALGMDYEVEGEESDDADE